MTLDPGIAALQAAGAGLPAMSTLSTEAARARGTAGDRDSQISVHRVEDRSIPAAGREISIRIYSPESPAATVVFAHGGGWVLGDLETCDDFCRALAATGRIRVISVDYRLAPEHPFPAGLDDVRAVAAWTVAMYPDAPIGICGDSSGGNLAGVVGRELGAALRAVVLIHPVLDLDFTTSSFDDPDASTPIGRAEMEWFRERYAPPETWGLAETSPCGHPAPPEHPSTYVLTVQACPMRDEGAAYAAALRTAGVHVVHEHADTMCHGFLRLADLLPGAAVWRDRIVTRTVQLLLGGDGVGEAAASDTIGVRSAARSQDKAALNMKE